MHPIVTDARAAFGSLADSDNATAMAAYMKTTQPFFGVKRPQRVPLERHLAKTYAPSSQDEYEDAVLALWQQPEREMQYTALAVARKWKTFVTTSSLPLYLRLVREGAWWDLVDELAAQLVGRVWLLERDGVGTLADDWIDDDCLWIRRTALLGQLKHKHDTDSDRLFAYCRRRMDEREPFIRKAIGWALRQYSYIAPDEVIAFLEAYRDELSALSLREGAKRLVRDGLWVR